MAQYLIEDATLTAIGDAIRDKEGSTDTIPVPDMASRIGAIQTGGVSKVVTTARLGDGVSIGRESLSVSDYGYLLSCNTLIAFGGVYTSSSTKYVHAVMCTIGDPCPTNNGNDQFNMATISNGTTISTATDIVASATVGETNAGVYVSIDIKDGYLFSGVKTFWIIGCNL